MWSVNAPQGNESAKIRFEIVQYTRGRGLDIGCGPWKCYAHFIGVDQVKYQGVDIVSDAGDLSLFQSGKMDFVFSSHTLEDMDDTLATLKEWWRVIKSEGYLVLYLPHADYYPNMGEEGANPAHQHDFRPRDVIGLMNKLGGWNLLVNEERNGGNEYSFLQVYQKRKDKETSHKWMAKPPKKSACVIRYGGFGDMLQASSILPSLKEQGYHITFMTTPQGREIVKHNPCIDSFFLQDTDQVPNQWLPEFWKVQSAKFDKWINLSESVEGTYLALPGRAQHQWSKEARHKLLDDNYLEVTHLLAGVPYSPNGCFYPASDEVKWAEKERKGIDSERVILWILTGSSVHKVWPHVDTVVARIMLYWPDIKVVFSGDELSQLGEAGWENEPRVIKRCGKWSIRQTLTFATKQSDLVIGPETGILNAVAFSKIPKIICLSHSSVNNLTRDWINTTSLVPEGCHCYPCHMLHYGFEYCNRDEETGVALCQAKISPDAMWNAINLKLRGERKNDNLGIG